MKKNDRKKIIKKRIEITNGQKILIGKSDITNKEKKLRVQPNNNIKTPKPVIPTSMSRLVPQVNPKKINMGLTRLEKDNARQKPSKPLPVKPGVDIPVVLQDYGPYVKETNVDYDVVICVTSFERYDKIRRLINQLYTQKSKYTFKFILLNDASTDNRYDTLPHEFPDMVYLKNRLNGGKVHYHKTVNKLWAVGNQYKSHAFLQIDDDFILCNNFLNILMDEFFKQKNIDNTIMVFSYHMYGYHKDKPLADWWYNGVSIAIDGGTLFDRRFLNLFRHYIDIGEKHIAAHTSTFVWDTIVKHIRTFGVRVYRTPKSLAWHDGNYDSKLNYEARKTKKSYTKNFIDGDDKYDPDKEFNKI